ncbi:Transcriptional regulator, TetR family [Candidatus Burkholderia verschuerenii]|uniref:Transcriptional regulator, TetR family n=1 Tax=Candidatus Burkholderia verschuerenii TaxID=242163 RepID=A0A0L0MHN3_9BURK|nr:TetR/AcrR family transcriptional regulator [Candidatus Burkholderia verschuerenii]KND61805.1 Transcriptional regulator, TetR family [Candidatus Burkholderia verschuerenii]
MRDDAIDTEPASPKKPGRRPGRPSGGHGADAREHLLNIALELFARQGIGETTLGAIAREAGVTPAMVHYYFKTREQLLDMLIDERFAPLRTELARIFSDPDAEPADTLRAFVEALAATVDRHPWFAALWVREVISEGGLLRQRMAARFGEGNKDRAVERIAAWQRDGKLNPELDPSLVFMSLFGLTVLPLATARWRDQGERTLTTEGIARYAVALLMHGIRPF